MRKRKRKRVSLFKRAIEWVRCILSIIVLLLALRWTTVYNDIKDIRKSWRKVYYRIEFAEGRRRGHTDWGMRFYQTFKGHF